MNDVCGRSTYYFCNCAYRCFCNTLGHWLFCAAWDKSLLKHTLFFSWQENSLYAIKFPSFMKINKVEILMKLSQTQLNNSSVLVARPSINLQSQLPLFGHRESSVNAMKNFCFIHNRYIYKIQVYNYILLSMTHFFEKNPLLYGLSYSTNATNGTSLTKE